MGIEDFEGDTWNHTFLRRLTPTRMVPHTRTARFGISGLREI